MPTLRFTDLSLEKLKSETQTRYMDSSLPGFGVLVGKRRKTFFVVSGTSRKLKTLGRYPAKPLKIARQEALRILDGSTPTQGIQKPEERLDEYLRSMNTQTPRYNYEQRRLLQRHLLPHTTNLAKVTKADILRITDTLVDRPSEQLHFCRAVKAFFNWLVARDYLQSSPVNVITNPKENTRERVLAPWELEIIWQKAASVPPFGMVIRLCVLLGTRKAETSAIEESWIGENLTIPAARTKNRTEHILPLTDRARSLALRYAKMPKPNWNSWNREKENAEWQDSIHNVTDWNIHDLRRTFATIHAQIGTPPHIIEAMLNHKSGQISGVAAIYNRYRYLPEMRNALEAYERYLEPRIFKTWE